MSKAKGHKKFSVLDVIRWLLLLVALVAAVLLVRRVLEYNEGQDTYTDMASQFTAPVSTETEVGSGLLQVDLEGLRQQNPDIIGWLQIDSLNISYPVLKAADNAYYLHRLPDGSYNASGSLFMDANNTGFEDWHSIIYGHNMRDGSMFAGLLKYLAPDFYKENGGDIIVYTLDGIWRYEMFMASRVAPDSTLYTIGFTPGEAYDTFVQQVYGLRYYNMGIEPTGADHILTLSTCTGDGENRVVVCARRVERLDTPADGQ